MKSKIFPVVITGVIISGILTILFGIGLYFEYGGDFSLGNMWVVLTHSAAFPPPWSVDLMINHAKGTTLSTEEIEIMKQYYSKNDITIIDAFRSTKNVCLPESCLRVTYHLLIPIEDVQKLMYLNPTKLQKLPSTDPNSNQINITTETNVKYENVPWEHIRLNPLKLVGNETDPLYRSYGFPEEDFRFVCEEPCFDYIDEEMIIAEYWEFKNVHGPLLDFMGNANLHHSRLPLDFHLNDDSVCNDYDIVVPGYSHRYIEDINGKSVGGRTYVCLYNVERGDWFNGKQVTSNYYLSDIEESTAHQQLAIHEYSHPILSRLLTPNFYVVEEDIAKVASFYVGEQEFLRTDENNNNFLQKVTDPCDPLLDREWSSKTIYELCQQNGLTFDDFTLSMSRLKDLKEQQGSTTYYDWDLILNDILGSETRQAFLDSTLPEDLLEP